MVLNKSLVLTRYLTEGMPVPGQDLAIKTTEIDLDTPPPEGGILLKTNYISYDPYQRGRMRPDLTSSYLSSYALNEPISNSGFGTVLTSANPSFVPGDLVFSFDVPFSEYNFVTKEVLERPGVYAYRKLTNPAGLDAKYFLGALGMSGMTAYSSFYELAKAKKGEVLWVSAASGAVGQIVGQLGKREGMKVIGSVGSEEKLRFIKEELGFDAGFCYKSEGVEEGLKRCLKEVGAEKVDVYFDNVGGETLDIALLNMNVWGRILACGFISQTNKNPNDVYRLKNIGVVDTQRLSIVGFLVSDPQMLKYLEEQQTNMYKWILDGSIKIKMSVTDGMENAAEGLVGILKGDNFGKAVLKVAEL